MNNLVVRGLGVSNLVTSGLGSLALVAAVGFGFQVIFMRRRRRRKRPF